MKIGIDISPLQGPHRMRGIGYAIQNFINHISPGARKKHSFVFFVLSDNDTKFGDPLGLLDTKGMDFEIRKITMAQKNDQNTALPSQGLFRRYFLNRIKRLINKLSKSFGAYKSFHFGDPREQNLENLDAYIQPDQSISLPKKHGLKNILVVYDIIPYVLDGEYLNSFRVARQRGNSLRRSAQLGLSRWFYAHKLKASISRAEIVLSISNHTKDDFVNRLGVSQSKIVVTPLGVDLPVSTAVTRPELRRYVSSSWGYISRPYKLPDESQFLLFVGGADRRRRLSDLVTAFNNLRAQGHDLKLVLSGDIMQGPDNIPVEETQKALKSSSYLEDIIFLGFTDDRTRDWLYQNALAFVYPSIYEGFGLPVLEAMSYGCPVICYDNSSVREVGGDAPLYAQDAETIRENILALMTYDSTQTIKIRNNGLKQASLYTWPRTSESMLSAIENLA